MTDLRLCACYIRREDKKTGNIVFSLRDTDRDKPFVFNEEFSLTISAVARMFPGADMFDKDGKLIKGEFTCECSRSEFQKLVRASVVIPCYQDEESRINI